MFNSHKHSQKLFKNADFLSSPKKSNQYMIKPVTSVIYSQKLDSAA